MKKWILWGSGLILFILVLGWGMLSSHRVQDWLVDRVVKRVQQPVHRDFFQKDALRILLCGTGSPIYSPKRGSSCTAVFAGGHFFLFDIGPGAWKNIALWRIPAEKLTGIFFTHFHSDHVGELGEAVMQSWLAGRQKPLSVYGPKGVTEVVKGFEMAYRQDTSYRIRHHGFAMPAEGGSAVARPFGFPAEGKTQLVLARDGLRVFAFGVRHSAAPAVGYRVEYGGRSVVISGDTVEVKQIASVAKGADILFHEAIAAHVIGRVNRMMRQAGNKRQARLTKDVVEDHTTPVQAAKLANQAGVQLLVYTHVVPPPDNFLLRRLFLRGVSSVRSRGVLLGEDGDLFTLPSKSKKIHQRKL